MSHQEIDALNTHPYVAAAAAMDRTEAEARQALRQLKKLEAAAKATRAAYFEHHGASAPNVFDLEEARLLRACVAASLAYDDAHAEYALTGKVAP